MGQCGWCFRVSLLVAFAVASSLAAQPSRAAPLAETPRAIARIPYERFQLTNGLTVFLSPDSSTPGVTIDIWYRAGSSNETSGHTGVAHLVEHLMFSGSRQLPFSSFNAYTTADYTAYQLTVAPHLLETALWYEGNRMGYLFEQVDSVAIAVQRDVAANERRQRVENLPYGRAYEIMFAAAYPASHPYHWPAIGFPRDLDAVSLSSVQSFYMAHYSPGNATLAIVGNFRPTDAKQWVEKYFGQLPPAAWRSRANPRPTPLRLDSERRLFFEDSVRLPRLYLWWPTVAATHQDHCPLLVLSELLAGGRTSRLHRALVYAQRSAAFVSASQWSRALDGSFVVSVTPQQGQSLTIIEQTTDSVIRRLARRGPGSNELLGSKSVLILRSLTALQSPLARAELLNEVALYADDPDAYSGFDACVDAVSARDVRRVARRYLGAPRIALSIVPKGKGHLSAKPEASVRVMLHGGSYIWAD